MLSIWEGGVIHNDQESVFYFSFCVLLILHPSPSVWNKYSSWQHHRLWELCFLLLRLRVYISIYKCHRQHRESRELFNCCRGLSVQDWYSASYGTIKKNFLTWKYQEIKTENGSWHWCSMIQPLWNSKGTPRSRTVSLSYVQLNSMISSALGWHLWWEHRQLWPLVFL